jgi:hypothetical protein
VRSLECRVVVSSGGVEWRVSRVEWRGNEIRVYST